MNFVEKNNAVIRLTNSDQFEADKNLFDEKRPNSKLHKRLRNVNQFNRKELDEAMLFEMLEYVSVQEILANRKEAAGEQKKSEETSNDNPGTNGSGNGGGNSADGTNTETGTGGETKKVTKAKPQKKSKKKKSSKKSGGKKRKKK
ncbi:MAG: hypothetical protein JEY96_01565 [Bacteroidales bacterium]|nr:hypothetical protein [Bacteroidales bacterium]